MELGLYSSTEDPPSSFESWLEMEKKIKYNDDGGGGNRYPPVSHHFTLADRFCCSTEDDLNPKTWLADSISVEEQNCCCRM